MDDALLGLVLARLDDVPLAAETASLLLAASDSDASLSAQFSGQSPVVAERFGERMAAEPAGAYLRAISISGFHGVGPASRLELEPGPGLTLAVGRVVSQPWCK